jgi:putative transposase
METPFSYTIRNQNAMHLLTFIVIDWDGPTIRDFFSRKIYRDIVIESLKFYQKSKGVNFRYNCSSNSNSKSISKKWI